MKKTSYLILLFINILLFSSCNFQKNQTKEPATFVGRQTCMECHPDEFYSWKGSDHDMAMDTAIAETVLGDFDNAEFERDGFVNRMYKKDGKFYVHTRGPGGKPGDFQIAYTFGYRPLQQYLVPFEDGRLQCLQITWDTDKNRWYHLSDSVYHGDVVKPDDWLYWTNNGQNWNGMCAECHSTNLKKNYDPNTHVFNTTWSEIDVSCEACHGPGSEHNKWAALGEGKRPEMANSGFEVQTRNLTSQQLVGQCAYCHARRSSFGDFVHPRKNEFDIIGPQMPVEPYYHVDGQILEEDYVYASFTQSKMYMNNVRCTDCHDVHSLKVKFGGDNRLCQQCHVKADYDTHAHHFHKYEGEDGNPIVLSNGKETIEVGEGAKCINCHMPGGYYMGVDFRRDHSMRIPRPDLSVLLGTPNACNSQCHKDKSLEWAASFTKKWYGTLKRPQFGEVFSKAILGDASSVDELTGITVDKLNPPIVRAAATIYLGHFPTEESNELVRELLDDPDPMVRNEAAKSFVATDMDDLVKSISPLLSDSTRLVRLSASLLLSAVPSVQLDSLMKSLLDTGIKEYIEVMEYSADFATSRHNLGNLYSNIGETKKAEDNFKEAIRIDNLFYPAKINLAMLYNREGKNDKAEILLKDVVENHPELPDTYYSLGLLMAEKGDYREAAAYLQAASELMPDRPRVFYNLGLVHQYLKNGQKAGKAFVKAYELDPENPDYLMALIDFHMKSNMNEKAGEYVKEWLKKHPDDKSAHELLEMIKTK
ncbi:MAG: tetratricopeptide repeat protein [Chlorobi bacterium]|nr:tetratricopeptide repeat protein [Chlorobiota bacterium]